VDVSGASRDLERHEVAGGPAAAHSGGRHEGGANSEGAARHTEILTFSPKPAGYAQLVTWQGGVFVALGSSLIANLGALWRQRGAANAPEVDGRHPIRTVVGLFRMKWWTIGYVAAAFAWLLHLGALAIAPLSIVQASLATGFVFLGLLAVRFFGFELGKREWTAMVVASAGLAFLAVTAGNVHGSQSTYDVASMIAFEAAMVGLGALLIMLGRRAGGAESRGGVLLGAGAGALFTATHVGLKALTHHFDGPLSLVSPWAPIVVGGAVVAFFASARSLQIGPAVPVIAVTSIAGNATSIAAGVVVFGDPLGDGPMIAARVAAFAIVVVVAAILTGELHAEGDRRARERLIDHHGRAAAPGIAAT
jgi:drug/metabolite transporter (DMT)-like permease